jgi:hypothetical protein
VGIGEGVRIQEPESRRGKAEGKAWRTTEILRQVQDDRERRGAPVRVDFVFRRERVAVPSAGSGQGLWTGVSGMGVRCIRVQENG